MFADGSRIITMDNGMVIAIHASGRYFVGQNFQGFYYQGTGATFDEALHHMREQFNLLEQVTVEVLPINDFTYGIYYQFGNDPLVKPTFGKSIASEHGEAVKLAYRHANTYFMASDGFTARVEAHQKG